MASNEGDEPLSETSPLLPRTSAVDQGISRLVDPTVGIVPEGVEVVATYEDPVGEENITNGVDGAEIERQISQASNDGKYQGLPEVKKRLKYILPAVGCGVGVFFSIR